MSATTPAPTSVDAVGSVARDVANPPTRGVGLLEALPTLPDALIALFAVITQLGDPWFLFVLFATLHWFGADRLGLRPGRHTATLLGIGLGALALTTGLKPFFGLPRPPGATTVTPPTWLPAALDPAFRSAATGGGYGFPSGHAIGSTVAYGGLAALARRGSRGERALAAAGVIGVVCLSRILLGVHYLVDVIAGVGVGLAFLGVAFGVVDIERHPWRAYALAAAVSVVAIAVAIGVGYSPREATAGLGATLGGFAVWYGVEKRDRTVYATDVGLLAGAAGLAVTGGIWVATYFAEPPLVVTLVTNAVAVGGVLALPTVVAWARARGKPTAVEGEGKTEPDPETESERENGSGSRSA